MAAGLEAKFSPFLLLWFCRSSRRDDCRCVMIRVWVCVSLPAWSDWVQQANRAVKKSQDLYCSKDKKRERENQTETEGETGLTSVSPSRWRHCQHAAGYQWKTTKMKRTLNVHMLHGEVNRNVWKENRFITISSYSEIYFCLNPKLIYYRRKAACLHNGWSQRGLSILCYFYLPYDQNLS